MIMMLRLFDIVNLMELDIVCVDGKQYTGNLYIVKQAPDYNQMIRVFKDKNFKIYFVFNNITFSGKFICDLD
jgi:hypothetical protein